MSPANSRRAALSLRHLFAGLQAGTTGAFAMLLLSMAASALSRRSVWLLPNLFATTFFGETAYRSAFVRSTWSGLALFFVIYGLLGMLFGAVIRDHRRSLLMFGGALYGLVCFYALFHFAWRHWNPLVPLYSPDTNLRLGHVIWGMFLARSPVYSQRIRDASGKGPVSTDPEIKTGELIR